MIIYNIPPRSVIDMSPETMGRLAHDFNNIVGVKDATGKIERVSEQRITCGKEFIQLSGEDASALGFNAHGGVGASRSRQTSRRRLCAEFQEASLAGDRDRALDLQDRLMPLHKAIFIEPGSRAPNMRCPGSARRRTWCVRRWSLSSRRPPSGSTPPCSMPG